mgnify:CR=1 FL=1
MLELFRKYQRFIFIVVTVVIILSFSFFGTYNTLSTGNWREDVAFQAIDGSEVSRADEEEMALFLATDADDKAYYGGAWGPNFLNDGVIKKDFLTTGLATEIVAFSPEDFRDDLMRRLDKEKSYHPYQHPGADFLSANAVWTYFAPEIPKNLQDLITQDDPASPKAFQARANLYLAERKFPPYLLRQFLVNQEKQYKWISPDPQLSDLPLSLFNYRGFEDWFGSKLQKKIARFVIETALVAEREGEYVSKSEALKDLLDRAKESFSLYRNTKNLGVTSPTEYFQEQLRLLNMDQTRAVRVWRQVLLFRKYFHKASVAAANSVAPHTEKAETASRVVLYQLPKELHLATSKAWEELEIYLAAVAPPVPSLDMPTDFFSPKDVATLYPELTQRRLVLEIQELSYKKLIAQLSVKELLDWQMHDTNWGQIEEKFRTLSGQGTTLQNRLEALQKLDQNTKMQLNTFTKEQILQQRPSFALELLNRAPPSTQTLYVRSLGGKEIIPGTSSPEVHQKLVSLLDQAPVGSSPEVNSPLYAYSPNKKDLYRITVQEREDLSLIPFWEAKKERVLEKIKPSLLDRLYQKDRSLYPSIKKSEKTPFSDIAAQVENAFFLRQQKQLETVLKQIPGLSIPELSKEQAAKFRFYPYMHKVLSSLQSSSISEDFFVRTRQEIPSSATEQWKLVKQTLVVQPPHLPTWLPGDLFSTIKLGGWSSVLLLDGGNEGFLQLEAEGADIPLEEVSKESFLHTQHLQLEAKRSLALELLQKMEPKGGVHVGE